MIPNTKPFFTKSLVLILLTISITSCMKSTTSCPLLSTPRAPRYKSLPSNIFFPQNPDPKNNFAQCIEEKYLKDYLENQIMCKQALDEAMTIIKAYNATQ